MDVRREIKLQESETGTFRIVITNKYGIVDNIFEENSLLEALNIIALLANGPDYMFDENTLKIAI